MRGSIDGDWEHPNAEWVTFWDEYTDEFFISLKELKPCMKPGWYNYLIDNGELPELSK